MEWANRARQVKPVYFQAGVFTFLPVAVITQGLTAVEVFAFEVQVTESADHPILGNFNFAALGVESSF